MPRQTRIPAEAIITAVISIVVQIRRLPLPLKSQFSSSAATRLPATPNGMPIIRKNVFPKYCPKSGSVNNLMKLSNPTNRIGSNRK